MSEDKYTQTFGRSVLTSFNANVAVAVATVDAMLLIDPTNPRVHAYRDMLMSAALKALSEEDLANADETYTWTDEECADKVIAIVEFLQEEKRLLIAEYDLFDYDELPEEDEGALIWTGKADAVSDMRSTLHELADYYLPLVGATDDSAE